MSVFGRDDYGALVWPKRDRATFPRRFVKIFSWHQAVAWTPKVGRWSLVITVRVLPRYGGVLVGLWAGNDDDGEPSLRVGAGAAELQIDVMRWLR